MYFFFILLVLWILFACFLVGVLKLSVVCTPQSTYLFHGLFWLLSQLGLCNAFLHSILQEMVYMQQWSFTTTTCMFVLKSNIRLETSSQHVVLVAFQFRPEHGFLSSASLSLFIRHTLDCCIFRIQYVDKMVIMLVTQMPCSHYFSNLSLVLTLRNSVLSIFPLYN